MSETTRWGVIGSGGIAPRRTIPEGIMPADRAQLVFVFDTDPSVNEAVAQEFDIQACERLDELLAADIDIVYVASPAGIHYEQVLACAQAGRFVEIHQER